MKLIIIRHGETTGDIEDRYGGAYDDLLSPEGEHQVKQLAEELAHQGIEHIFTSPLKRAQQTAQSLTKTTAKEKFPELVTLLKDKNNTLPNAESYTDATQHMASAFQINRSKRLVVNF